MGKDARDIITAALAVTAALNPAGLGLYFAAAMAATAPRPLTRDGVVIAPATRTRRPDEPDAQQPRRVILRGLAAPYGLRTMPVHMFLKGSGMQVRVLTSMRMVPGCFEGCSWDGARLLLDHDVQQDEGGTDDGRLRFHLTPRGLEFEALIEDPALVELVCEWAPLRMLGVSPLLESAPDGLVFTEELDCAGTPVHLSEQARTARVHELSITRHPGFMGAELSLSVEDADCPGRFIVQAAPQAEQDARAALALECLHRGDLAPLGLEGPLQLEAGEHLARNPVIAQGRPRPAPLAALPADVVPIYAPR